jgi:hypothetical protein
MRVIIELADGSHFILNKWDCALIAIAALAIFAMLFTSAVRCAGG